MGSSSAWRDTAYNKKHSVIFCASISLNDYLLSIFLHKTIHLVFLEHLDEHGNLILTL